MASIDADIGSPVKRLGRSLPNVPMSPNGTANGHGVKAEKDKPLRNFDSDADVKLHPSPLRRERISPWIIIPIWIFLSGSIVLFNKHIFSTLGFPYPVFLTAFHMLFATLGTRVLEKTTSLLKELKEDPVDRKTWLRAILPIGAMFSISLVFSNIAYVHLSVSFVQMMKASVPVLSHLFTIFLGMARLDYYTAVTLTIITVGCVIASSGEIRFDGFGFFCQVAAIVSESIRLVLVQILLHRRKMNPLVSIYYYAPLCGAMILAVIPFTEGLEPIYALPQFGFGTLFLSGALAFALNVAGVFLIESTGSLVLTLCGVFKDIILIALSVSMLDSHVTGQQTGGYGMALFGLLMFKFKDNAASIPLKRVTGETGSRLSSRYGKLRLRVGYGILLSLGCWLLFRSRYRAAKQFDTTLSRSIKVPIPFEARSMETKRHTDIFNVQGAASDWIPEWNPEPPIEKLPNLAWVVMLEGSDIAQNSPLLQQLSCYSLRTGIPLYYEFLPSQKTRTQSSAFHYNTAKHLRRHQWVLVTGPNVVVSNSTVDLRNIIWSAVADDVDVITHDLDEFMVGASAYMLHNTPGGWGFLKRLAAWSEDGLNPHGTIGDLNEIIVSGLSSPPDPPSRMDGSGRMTRAEIDEVGLTPDQEECTNLDEEGWYEEHFAPCVRRRLQRFRSVNPWKPWWSVRLFKSSQLPPVSMRIYRLFGGFIRVAPGSEAAPFKGAVGSDFLFLDLEGTEIIPRQAALCTGDEWHRDQRQDSDTFKSWVGRWNPYSYHECWTRRGTFVCGVDSIE